VQEKMKKARETNISKAPQGDPTNLCTTVPTFATTFHPFASTLRKESMK
jgi:hypothetical protein